MNRLKFIAILATSAWLFVSCAPVVIVENRTTIPVRVIVTSRGGSETVSPSPGESSTVAAAQGRYKATAIPDAEWIEYAKLTRKVLNDQLANADRLTGSQLLDVIRRLKDIATRIQQFEQTAGSSAGCAATLSSESDGVVVISLASNGKLAITCR